MTRPLVPGEHRSKARRRSWRRYNARNAPRIRQSARTWYWAHHAHCLAKKAAWRRKQWPAAKWGCRPVSEQEWQDIRDFYQQTRAMGSSLTFKELGARFRVSPRRIQRRSSKDGGWSRRYTPEPAAPKAAAR